jgi:hypothetical protein
MELHRIGTAALVIAAALGACKKDDKKAEETKAAGTKTGEPAGDNVAKKEAAPGECAPMSIKVDGKDRSTGWVALAVTMKNGEYLTEEVELYDDPTMNCERALAGNPNLPPEATEIRAYYNEYAMGLGTEAYTDMSAIKIELVKKAEKPGDPTVLCLPAATFTPNAGTLSGKKVEVSGRFEGAWCGVKDFTPK